MQVPELVVVAAIGSLKGDLSWLIAEGWYGAGGDLDAHLRIVKTIGEVQHKRLIGKFDPGGNGMLKGQQTENPCVVVIFCTHW